MSVPTTKIYSGQADNCKVTIDKTHQESHEGHAYTVSFTSVVGAAGRLYFSFISVNPTKKPHFIYSVNGSDQIGFWLFENSGSLVTGSLTSTAIRNLNRNIGTTGSVVCFSSVTTGSGVTGSNLATYLVGTSSLGSQTQGALRARDFEWILVPQVVYMGCISSSAAANQIGFDAVWYEE